MPLLIVYALVGRYQMIDLEAERSFVRKLLGQGIDVYMVDWGLPRPRASLADDGRLRQRATSTSAST